MRVGEEGDLGGDDLIFLICCMKTAYNMYSSDESVVVPKRTEAANPESKTVRFYTCRTSLFLESIRLAIFKCDIHPRNDSATKISPALTLILGFPVPTDK